MTFLLLPGIWFLWLNWFFGIPLLFLTMVCCIYGMTSICHPRLWRLHWRSLSWVGRRQHLPLHILSPWTITWDNFRVIESLDLPGKGVIVLDPWCFMIDGVIEKSPPIPPLVNTLIIALPHPLFLPGIFMLDPIKFLGGFVGLLPIEGEEALHIMKSYIGRMVRASLNIFLLSTKYPFLARCSMFIFYFLFRYLYDYQSSTRNQ